MSSVSTGQGGNWNNAGGAGVFCLNVNNNSANSNNNVGGRDSIFDPKSLKDGTIGDTGGCFPAKSEIKMDVFSSSKYCEGQHRSKRLGGLFERAFTIENLHIAFKNASKNKESTRKVAEFKRQLGSNLKNLRDEILKGTYRPEQYKRFFVTEPKRREIKAPAFRDSVVQHAIYLQIYDIFNKSFVDTSFACRRNGGTHKAKDYVIKTMRKLSGDQYFLQLDIKKFFHSIIPGILNKLIIKKIKDRRFLNVVKLFNQENKGIAIGNLLSQLFALIYLNPLDHYIKRELKVKHYVRYVDDFVLFGLTLDQCKDYLSKIQKWLKDNLQLELSKYTIKKVKNGINFVGYRIWRSRQFVRKHSLYKFKKALKLDKMESVASLLGHAKDTSSFYHFLRLASNANKMHLLPKKYHDYKIL